MSSNITGWVVVMILLLAIGYILGRYHQTLILQNTKQKVFVPIELPPLTIEFLPDTTKNKASRKYIKPIKTPYTANMDANKSPLTSPNYIDSLIAETEKNLRILDSLGVNILATMNMRTEYGDSLTVTYSITKNEFMPIRALIEKRIKEIEYEQYTLPNMPTSYGGEIIPDRYLWGIGGACVGFLIGTVVVK